ncbi:hypothetical protein DNTS_006584, partial [Danionella cerebrum]
KRIPGTRFIAFKVPLKKSFDHLTRSEAFGPSDLVHLVKKEKEDLGLIIDLTFTTRYYSVQVKFKEAITEIEILVTPSLVWKKAENPRP